MRALENGKTAMSPLRHRNRRSHRKIMPLLVIVAANVTGENASLTRSCVVLHDGKKRASTDRENRHGP